MRGKVIAYRYRSTSKLGNNAYTVCVQLDNGYAEIFDVAANSSLNNSVLNSEMREHTHIFQRNARGQLTRAVRAE